MSAVKFGLLVDAWRRIGEAHKLIALIRAEYLALDEMLRIALNTIRDLRRALAQSRDQNYHLSAQVRALMTGRTIAAERQDIDRELHDVDEHDDQEAA